MFLYWVINSLNIPKLSIRTAFLINIKRKTMNKYLVEFIGTFFLILTVVLTVNNGTGSFAPIAIGGVLMVMIYAGGHISGAHYNPAVTLAVCLRGKCDWSDMPGYIIAQLAGGGAAAMVAALLLGSFSGYSGEMANVGTWNFGIGALSEFLGTFALVWVVLHTATTKSNAGNSHYGLAIGFTVVACAYALGGITGGAFNPAVAVGLVTAKMSVASNLGSYLVGQLAAGALAAVLFGVVYGKED